MRTRLGTSFIGRYPSPMGILEVDTHSNLLKRGSGNTNGIRPRWGFRGRAAMVLKLIM